MTKNQFITLLMDFTHTLKQSGFAVFGCNDEQINLLERKYGYLPEFYKIYLTFIGIDAGDFNTSTIMSYIDLDDINNITLKLMHENNIITTKNIFAFLMHQGNTSLFFNDLNHEDPMVYCYNNTHQIIDTGKSFSQYLESEFNQYKNAHAFLANHITQAPHHSASTNLG